MLVLSSMHGYCIHAQNAARRARMHEAVPGTSYHLPTVLLVAIGLLYSALTSTKAILENNASLAT